MFWDRAAGVYDLFANVWNKKTHGALCAYVEAQISPADEVLECACGTGPVSYTHLKLKNEKQNVNFRTKTCFFLSSML